MTQPTETVTTVTTVTTVDGAGNLTQPLQSAVFIPMDSSRGKAVAAGNRWCKLIKKGENSKLGQSVAVEVPALRASQLDSYMAQGAIADAVLEYVQSLQDAYIKSRAVAGAASIQYSELTPELLGVFLATSEESGRIGQLSVERITNWFTAEARELLIVALADRLGIADTATPQEVTKLEQLANQTRDNLAKLASKKPVQFDERVKAALLWALEVTDSGDSITPRLVEKLTAKVSDSDMLASLGF